MNFLRTVALTVLSLTGCSDEVWYRVVPTTGGWIIARADIGNDSCAIMRVYSDPSANPDEVVTGIEVELADAEFAHVAYVSEGPGNAAGCTPDYYGAGMDERLGTEGSGTVRLREISYVDGRRVACKVKLRAEIDGVKFHETAHIWDDECPPPSGGEKRTYDAPHARLSGTLLSVTAWDPKTSTCASLGFEVDVGEDMQPIVMPEHWKLYGGQLLYMEDAQSCNSPEPYGGDSPPVRLDVSSLDETHSGRLGFEASEVGEIDGTPIQFPCRLSLDVSMELPQEYYWVPRFLTIEGFGVVVDGACG